MRLTGLGAAIVAGRMTDKATLGAELAAVVPLHVRIGRERAERFSVVLLPMLTCAGKLWRKIICPIRTIRASEPPADGHPCQLPKYRGILLGRVSRDCCRGIDQCPECGRCLGDATIAPPQIAVVTSPAHLPHARFRP